MFGRSYNMILGYSTNTLLLNLQAHSDVPNVSMPWRILTTCIKNPSNRCPLSKKRHLRVNGRSFEIINTVSH